MTSRRLKDGALNPILTYRDLHIYPYHLDFLQPGNWFDDVVINFCYMTYEEKYAMQNRGKSDVLLLDTSVVACLRIQVDCEEEFLEIAAGQAFDNYEWIAFSINDSESFENKGCHWSLLLCHWKTLKLIHLDSSGQSNYRSALSLARKLSNFSKKRLQNIISLKVPQQENCSDCGAYTAIFAERANLFLNDYPMPSTSDGIDTWFADLTATFSGITDEVCKQFRYRIIEQIEYKVAENLPKEF